MLQIRTLTLIDDEVSLHSLRISMDVLISSFRRIVSGEDPASKDLDSVGEDEQKAFEADGGEVHDTPEMKDVRTNPAASSKGPAEPSQDLDVDRITRAWRAFMAYRGLSLQVFDTQALSYSHLPDSQQALIPNVPIRLSHAAEAAEHNADLLERVALLTGIRAPFVPEDTQAEDLDLTVSDFPDVVDTLLAVVRDWSAYGQKDRASMYDQVISAVHDAAEDALSTGAAAGNGIDNVSSFSILVIGASLGRLCWELARLGYAVQGVENSYLQLFTANFILNGAASPQKPLHLYPFVHHTGMVASADEHLREVDFPDVDPRQLEQADFSMVAGEFLNLYNAEASWGCIVTCFTLENSHSIISYIRRIGKVLKVGGVWINHGSLDFRYEDSDSEPSVEISKEELDFVIARSGLRVLRRESLSCRPPFFVTGMVQEQFESIFLVAVRV